MTSEPQRRHWRGTLRWTVALLAAWFAVSFGVAFFARDLRFDWLGFPFSVWVAAQGAPLVFLLLIALYARAMNRLDREFGGADD